MKTLAKAVGVAWVMVGIAGSDLEAQEDARQVGVDSTRAEVWQNMHEGGLISHEEYQHALQYGALPGRTNVEPPEGVEAAAEAARQAQEAAWAANREKHQYWHHQGLKLENGQIQSFPALKEKKRADLRARAAEIGARQRREKQEAEAWARRNNIAMRVLLPDGGAMELMSIRGGVPRFYITYNAIAADTVSTDELWPGGATGLDLTGAGTTMGIWDEADVLLTHQEFDSGPGTRVTDRDGTSQWGISGHATHVAGTLVAEGHDPTARGMSYGANLDAYDWDGDIGEMGNAAAEDELPISNHSYGTQAGWGFLVIEIEGEEHWFWAWYGDTTLSQVESYWFGFYDDVSRDIDATV